MNSKSLPRILSQLTKILLTVGLCSFAVWLGFALQQASGGLFVISPLAGIGLAVVLLGGWEMGLGVWLGGFFFHWLTQPGPTALPLAAVIATGSTLQIWAASWLMQRFSASLPPVKVVEAPRLIGISCLAALLNPLVGVTGLCLLGQVAWGDYAGLFRLWWFGDAIAVLMITPPLLLGAIFLKKRKVAEPFLWLFSSFIIGLTLLTFFLISSLQQQQINNRLRADLDEMSGVIQNIINNHEMQAITAISALCGSQPQVTRDEFRDFTAPFLTNFSNTSVYSWVDRVPASARADYEQSIRAQGFPDFYIFEKDSYGNNRPVGVRPEYFSVTYIEPFSANQKALGFDDASEQTRLDAVISARDSGKPAVTGPIYLVQDSRPVIGILLMMPVYQDGAAVSSVEERRASLRGLAVGVFRVDDLLKRALGNINPHDIDLFLYDIGNPDAPRFIGFYPSQTGPQDLPAAGAPSLAQLQAENLQTATIPVANRSWMVVARVGPAYVVRASRWIPWMSMLIGLLLAGAFLAHMYNRQRIETVLANSEAEFRALSDYALTGILKLKPSGEIVYANGAAAQMFGYNSSQELISAGLGGCIGNTDLFLDTLSQAIESSGGLPNQELDILTPGGEKRHLLYSAFLYQKVVSITLVDLTDRIRSGREFRQLSRIVSQMADTVVITDAHGVIEYVNPAFSQTTGYTYAEVLGKTPAILKSGIHNLEYYKRLWATILNGHVFQDEVANRKKNGDLYHEVKTITPIRGVDGVITHFVATGKDITERKQIEATLLQREAEYRLISENTGDAIWIFDVQAQKLVYASPSVEQLLGYTPQEMLATPLEMIFAPASRQHMMSLLHDRIASAAGQAGPTTYTNDAEQIRKDGALIWTEVVTTYVYNQAGKQQVVCITRDITRRKQAEILQETVYRIADAAQNAESLQELYPLIHRQISQVMYAENFYIALYDDTTDLMRFAYLVDNKETVELQPFKPGRGLTSHVLRTGESLLYRFDQVDASLQAQVIGAPSRVWLGVPLIAYGKTIGVMAVQHYSDERAYTEREQRILEFVSSQIATAITRKQADEQLRESDERFRQLAENIQEVFWMDEHATHKIIYISPAYETVWGRSCQSVYDDPLVHLESCLPEDRPIVLAANEQQALGQRTESEYRIQRPDGTIRWIWDRSFPIFDETDSLVRTAGVATDITDLKNAQAELKALNRDLERRVEERTEEVRQSEATYRALFENSNDGIFLLTPDGRELNANQPALDMVGYTWEEYKKLNQTKSNMVAAPEQQEDAQARFDAVLRGEHVPLYERTLIAKDGRKIQTEINLSAARDATGKIILVQSVVRDITERKKAEEALRESRDKLSIANAALEKASRLKDEFLASMSHELRTPLTGILGLSEALQLQTYGTLNEKQFKALRNIESSGRHLLELINDILDLSKIEAGRLELQFDLCPVSELCQASLQLVKGMAHQKKQTVDFSMHPASIVVQADVRRLKQMLVNLLSNAVKFTPEGGRLGLDVSIDESSSTIRFSVWDKGIGIKPEDMGKLFRPFVQLDSSLSRHYSGTGLGLSLVQRMADLHGGSISVESAAGEGSRFTILLPWSARFNQAVPLPTRRGTGSLKHALVIEDNPVDAAHLSLYLREVGVTSVIHPTLAGALEKAASLTPGIILLDLFLPDGRGMDLLALLKADERTRNTPVIIISAQNSRTEALNLGAAGHVLKPFTRQALHDELARVAIVAPAPDPAQQSDPGNSAPLVMVTDDNDLIFETLTDFLEAKGYRVITTRSGFELLERVSAARPDIILIDIQMPGMDGMEAMRRLRAHRDPQVASIPIIAVTALAMTGDREKCLQAGANDYMSKPVTLAQLAERIKKLLSA